MVGSPRNREIFALFFVAAVLAAGFGLVTMAQRESLPTEIFVFPVMAGSLFLVAHLTMRVWVPRSDPFLLPIVSALASLGLIMIYRLRPELVAVQILWLGVGTAALIVTFLLVRDIDQLQHYKYLAAVVGLLLLLSPIFIGREVHGARLWLSIGPFSFQPSEISKLLIVVFLAGYLKEKKELLSVSRWKRWRVSIPEPKHWGPLVTMWLVSLSILVFQKDLGSSLLFFGLFVGMLYIATGQSSFVLLGALLFLAGAFTSYYSFDHVTTRIDVWLDPWVDVAGKGFQIVQSLFAIASGGLAGVGLGQGFPQTIPAVHTDFIFSALAEETGFLGATAVLILYLLFTYRGFRLAATARGDFNKLLAAGLTTAFA
ncbi:MAG: FtsW/RodA/SpoVE family cell cycle protein, partial [Terriglobia bacterium]